MKIKMISLAVLAMGLTACSPSGSGSESTQAAASSEARKLDYTLRVEEVRGQLYDPWQGEWDQVDLRSYQGDDVAEGIFAAPTMRVGAGETLNLRIENNLAPCTDEERETFTCFNHTNIHTHGLWISPSGNSDNVLVDIAPGESFDYAFEVPEDHPAGTFWYHPHMHGATSVQVGSGMAGALIVEGERLPTMDAPGDIDVLLKNADGSDFHERIWVMQQFQYACRDEEGRIRGMVDFAPTDPAWFCEEGDVGSAAHWDQYGPFQELFSRRLAAINGEQSPLFDDAVAGQFERWRLVHAGMRSRIRLSVRKVADDAPDHREILAGEHRNWIAEYCSGEALDLFHFADDGLTRDRVHVKDEITFFPGGRIDFATVYPEEGRYCVVNDLSSEDEPDNHYILAVMDVAAGDTVDGDSVSAFADRLMAVAEEQLDGDIENRVVSDLSDDLSLASFVWHDDITDEEIEGQQRATMSIIIHEDESGATLSIDGEPFDHNTLARILPLGTAEEWEVDSNLSHHPFHIHVNPFQVVGAFNEEGEDVTIPGSDAYDPFYADIMGTWRDTVIIKHMHTIRFRTRYKRYDGDFLMHCHFPSHGDAGMMQMVRIASEADYDAPIGSIGSTGASGSGHH